MTGCAALIVGHLCAYLSEDYQAACHLAAKLLGYLAGSP